MARRRGLLAELQRQSAIQTREAQRAQATYARQHAAAVREAERTLRASQRAAEQAARADVRAAAEAEKRRKQAYLEARQAEVAAKNTALQASITELDQLLTDTLSRDDHINIQTLKKTAEHPPFNPGADAQPLPAPRPPAYQAEPQWTQYAPPEPSGIAKAFGGRGRHEREVSAAKARFQEVHARWQEEQRQLHQQFTAAVADHQHREQQRLQRLDQARARYEQERQDRIAAVAEYNREINAFAVAFAARDPNAIVEYFDMVLANSVYPDSFPQHYRVAYVPESAQLVVEYGLPTIDAVPREKEYRYVKARDEIASVARPAKDVRSQYSSVVAQVALRTIHEIFEADRGGLVETVVFNGIVTTSDPSTGKTVTPCLVTLRVTREAFAELDLGAVDPLACLAHLHAAVSKRPDELAPVRPVLEFDMVDKRFVEETDVLSDLDRRPNLLELSPTEFEALIQNLFSRMGLDTKQTRPSRDGGVDCVAFDHRPIFGGKVVIQAKRYRHTVDVSAVRDLFGTVQNEGASKGILVTTSGYGQASYKFAAGKPLELLDGANLLALLAEHAQIEARIADPDKL
jgi:restriction system protein